MRETSSLVLTKPLKNSLSTLQSLTKLINVILSIPNIFYIFCVCIEKKTFASPVNDIRLSL